MPPRVDHDERRAQIVDAAIQCLSEGGPAALTVRGIAAILNGSVTTVTHYYDSRAAIIEDLNKRLAIEWQDELREIRNISGDPATRLWKTLVWLLPVGEAGQRDERMRFAVLAAREVNLLEPLRTEFNAAIEAHLAECLEPVVPSDRIDETVEVLRVFVAGVVLSYTEYPEQWPPDRQIELLKRALTLMQLPVPEGTEA